SSLQWWIADWWAFGEHHCGERTRALAEWNPGLTVETCQNYACVTRKFETSRRREVLTFSHHQEVAGLDPPDDHELLDWCEKKNADSGRPRSPRELREEKRRRLTAPQSPDDPDDADEPEPGDADEGKDEGERGEDNTAPDIFCRVI